MPPVSTEAPEPEMEESVAQSKPAGPDYANWFLPGLRRPGQVCRKCEYYQFPEDDEATHGDGSCLKIEIYNPLEDAEQNWCPHYEQA